MKKTARLITALMLAAIMAFSAVPAVIAFALDDVPEDIVTDAPDSGEETDTPAPQPANSSANEDGDEPAFIETLNVLGYRYRIKDSYFYIDQHSWQGNFGYNKMYDLIAPYVLLEYDYVRVHFNYDDKDWMVQLWKGQYGLAFFGAEAGIYYKEESDEEDTVYTTYDAVSGSDRPYMQMSLYHDALHNGDYQRLYTTPYEHTWWSSGFKPGHLLVQEPASELRQTGVITFENEELAALFAEGLEECGFGAAEGKENMPTDTCFRDGTSVYFSWQDISEAENTMPIKVTIGALTFFNILGLGALVLMSFLGLGLLFILI